MTVRERICEYLEYKGISRYQFYKLTGISNGYLDKRGAITTDKCELIINCFGDLNLEWLITGKGLMVRCASQVDHFPSDGTEQTTAMLDRITELASENSLLKAQVKSLRRDLRDSGKTIHIPPGEENDPEIPIAAER